MTRRLVRRSALAAAAIAAAVGISGAAAPGQAASGGNGQAYAAVAYAQPAAGALTPVAQPPQPLVSGGLLGTVLSLLGLNNITQVTSALTNNVANPLVAQLAALPQGIISNLTAGLIGANLSATSPAVQQPRPPAGTFPTCGSGGWTTSDCYGPLVPAVSGAPVITLATGLAQGYATGDSAGYVAAAKTVDPVLALLGIPIGDLGTITASAACGNLPNANCTGTQTVSGISLLGGAITATVADGAFTTIKVNGLSLPATGKTITALGLNVGIKLNGNLLSLSISVGTDKLLSALGTSLSALTSALGLGLNLGDTGTSATLTLNIGPSSPPTAGATSATAYGLAVTASLQADIKLGVSIAVPLVGTVNVAGVEVTAGSTTGPPNLLDLDLGYAAVTAGALPAAWIDSSAI